MRISLWSVGKAHESYVKAGVEEFTKRIGHYYKIDWQLIPTPKKSATLSEMDLLNKEGDIILEWLQPDDYLIALEETGKQHSSEELARFIQQRANESRKRLVFLIGGAYGLSDSVLNRANHQWSLSKLVFPHQLVRLILAEQLYRACTIIRGEKYHHA